MEAQKSIEFFGEFKKLKLTNGLNYEVPFQDESKNRENLVRSTFGMKKG